MRLTLRSLAAFCMDLMSVTDQAGRQKPRRGVIGRGPKTHACQLKDFGSQVLEHCCNVDCCLGANTHLVLGVGLEETLDTAAGELAR